MKRALFGVWLLALTACSGTQTAAQSQPPAAQTAAGANTVVGQVGGRSITLGELDEKWQTTDPAERARVTQLLYQNRRNVLDQLMGELLIDEAAKAAKLTSEQFVEQEVTKRVQPVGAAEVDQFYQANKERAPGQTLDQLRGPITEFLQSQRAQQARAQLVDELKKKRAADVKVMLDPPRQTIELAIHDPSVGPLNAPVTLVEFSDYQ
jgi:protein-disulfide isomerase